MLRKVMLTLVTCASFTVMGLLSPETAEAQKGKGGGAGVPKGGWGGWGGYRPYSDGNYGFYPRDDGRWGYYQYPDFYDRSVRINVRVPPNAELWVFDEQMPMRGPNQQIVTPPLAEGYRYYYDFTAAWMENGVLRNEKLTVTFQAGAQDELFVDFTRLTPPLAPAASQPPRVNPPVDSAPRPAQPRPPDPPTIPPLPPEPKAPPQK